MKKYGIYLGLVVVGLLLGWILFGNSTSSESRHDHGEVTEENQMWTCSMHPQIMQLEPGDCPICGMDLIPVDAGSDGLKADQFRLSEYAMALANVQTSVVEGGSSGDKRVKLSGTIVENEESNLVQVSYFSGRIEELHVSFTGEQVKEGQLLATVYSPDLYAAQQELITAATLKESQPNLYSAVRNKLKLWKLSDRQIEQIESTGNVLENFPIYATFSGTVAEKLVEQGDYVKEGQPLLKITRLNTVWAIFDVYESQIDLFRKGQEISITTNAYSDKEFQSKVAFIDPVLNQRTRTVKLRVVLDNKNQILKPGMFVEGQIEGVSRNEEERLRIPASAVLWTGERSVVYVKTDPEPVFEMREVTLGAHLGDSFEVISGLSSGEEIVTNGTFSVDASAQLLGKKSMMNKQGGRTTTGHEGHGGSQKHSELDKADHINHNERIDVSNDFKSQLNRVVQKYITLKEALVGDDPVKAKNEASAILEALDQVDMSLLSQENVQLQWMGLEKRIRLASSSIASTTEITEQRNQFKNLSSDLTSAVNVFGINQKVFNQFCPMADNNNGAYWLSLEEEVRNPYFGSAMHSCGNVAQVIE